MKNKLAERNVKAEGGLCVTGPKRGLSQSSDLKGQHNLSCCLDLNSILAVITIHFILWMIIGDVYSPWWQDHIKTWLPLL